MSEHPSPQRPAPAAGSAPDRLPPAPLTSFVGREREVATLLELLGETRLLSLTGTGGSGKTRLARALVAHAAERRGVEAVWVELAPLRAPEHLAGHVAAAPEVLARTGRPLLVHREPRDDDPFGSRGDATADVVRFLRGDVTRP